MTDAGAGRTLVIGLDVGDGHLVEAWSRAGRLANLRRLRDEGAWGWLGTTAETLHVSAWPSLYTGAMPGHHGVYYTHQPAPGEQGAVRFREDQYGVPPVWETLARAGHRSVVFDAPYTHPAPGVGGLSQIFEWGTWAHYWTPSAAPAELWGELERACGRYPLGVEANQIGLSGLDPADLTPKLVRSLGAKAKAARWLLGRDAWAHAWVVFGEPHPAAHYLWPAGRGADEVADAPADFARLGTVYEAVDAAIGALVEELGPNDTVFVVSGDGGGANHAGWHLLPDVLEELGYLVPPGGGEGSRGDGDAPGDSGDSSGEKPSKPSLYGRLRGLVPSSLRQNVSRYLPAKLRDALMKKNAAAAIDWSRTRAYCLPTDLEGCVRFNVRGREPEGIVDPAELDALAAELTERLMALVDADSGAPAVTSVTRGGDVLSGPRADQLPDLVVTWDEGAELRAVTGPGLGRIECPSPDERSGTHRPPGFVLVRGPGFAPGSTLEDAHVVDLAPTLLARHGVSSTGTAADSLPGRAWSGAAR